MTPEEWEAYLGRMDEHERLITAWEVDLPNPNAARCVHSRHRTLAHLRACQETWFQACLKFADKPSTRVKLLHPWRLFEQRSYEAVSWEEHMTAYKADRQRWKEFLESADRQTSGKYNGKDASIETMTCRLIDHEHHHLFTPR